MVARRSSAFIQILLGFAVLGGPVVSAQTVYRITLHEAIAKALAGNVSGQLAQEVIAESEGARQRSYAAALLPKVGVSSYASLQNRNLSAFGISGPGFPKVVGPFSNYDFRVSAQQNLLDLSSYRRWKASEQNVEANKQSFQNVRDDIVRSVAGLYLDAESTAARVGAAETRVNDSQTLLQLAKDKHDAGTATGVDVLRAEVQLANDKQVLLVAQNQYKRVLLALARTLGLSPRTPLELAEKLTFHGVTLQQVEALESAALQSRSDYRALTTQRQALAEQQKANRARWYPKLSLSGNYGALGRSVGSVEGTGAIQAQADFLLFDRDREGEAQELASRLRSIDERLADLRRGIEEEIREALLSIESASEQVTVAEQGRGLAERELRLAQDRFEQGTANNVEVVTAQDELARARENYILAVSSHVDAKFSLARALGNTARTLEELEQSGK